MMDTLVVKFGRDLVKGPGEEADLRGLSALLGVLEARGCGVARDQAAIREAVHHGQPDGHPALRVHRLFSLHHSRCSESAGGGFPSLLGECLLKDIPLLGFPSGLSPTRYQPPVATVAGAQ
jgi:hypothetical protein